MMGRKQTFEAHFLNVGHGDCTVLHHPGDERHPEGRVSVVDIHERKDRESDVAGLSVFLKDVFGSSHPESEEEYARRHLNDPVKYVDNNIDDGGRGVWRFVATHPDMDHLSGLARLDDEIGIEVFWDTFHAKTLSADQDEWPERFDPTDWVRYEKIRHGKTDHHYIQPTKGTKTSTWADDDIDIFHPSPAYIQQLNAKHEDTSTANYNDLSYVLKVNTPAGGILLPGDLESADAWERVLDYAEEELTDVRVLKAAHHGRENGFNAEAVRQIDPEYVIVSVGKKTGQDALAKYNRMCGPETEIYSTRQHGRLKVTVTEDGELDLEAEDPEGIFQLPE